MIGMACMVGGFEEKETIAKEDFREYNIIFAILFMEHYNSCRFSNDLRIIQS
jgi:hypothetical protein